MIRTTSLWRTLTASAALAASLALGGCETDGVMPGGRAMAPLSAQMVALIEQKGMAKESPVLVRLFKEEAELEVWKQDNTGRFALLKTYPICRWSGELGPKIKEGDRQAPEGFYTITPAQMNPNSAYYLSFNMGYPNPYDRALGRTGAELMVHGDCSSRGCYAMTDEQIGEIYALARESFFGGQRAFQVQAFPFKMTPLNMARHRNNPHMPFWRMIKQGYDQFEVSRLQPQVDFCEKRYVFNAEAPPNSTKALTFNAAGKCPAYVVAPDLVAAADEKRRNDDIQTAALIRRGTPAAPIRTGRDGGMHPVFLAALRPQQVKDVNGDIRMILPAPTAPGTIPAHVNPPRDGAAVFEAAPATAPTAGPIVANAPMPRPAPLPKDGALSLAAVPPPQPAPTGAGSLFNGLFSNSERPAPAPQAQPPGAIARVGRWMGIGGDDPKTANAAKAKPATKAAPAGPATAAAIRPAPPKNGAQPDPAAAPAPAPAPTQTANAPAVLPGAQPVVQADSFNNRFGPQR